MNKEEIKLKIDNMIKLANNLWHSNYCYNSSNEYSMIHRVGVKDGGHCVCGLDELKKLIKEMKILCY